MLLEDILKKVRKIEISSGKLVDEVFSGEYKSIFRGRGMEFSEVRKYYPGDDIRTIDWNVSARTGDLFIKKFVEERELTIFIMIDVSKSSFFGSLESKMDLSAEISGILSFSAMRNNDKVGLMLFSDKIEKFVMPKKGKTHILRMITDILSFNPTSAGTNVSGALEYFNKAIRKKAIVFIISDFLERDYEKELKITAKKNDLVCIKITDPFEVNIPAFGTYNFIDLETNEKYSYDAKKYLDVNSHKKNYEEIKNYFSGITKKNKIDKIDLFTDKPYIIPLIQFFKQREKKLKMGA